MKRQPNPIHSLLREDLPSFVEMVFKMLYPGTDYLDNWHIHAMCHALIECIRGKKKRLIITVPPRHLKSLCCSVALPAFVLGHDPSKSIICASYSNNLSGKHANLFRQVVEAPSYRKIFPKMRIDPRKNTELEVATTLNGGRLSTSVDGTLTGRGCDILILDDIMNPQQALSDAERMRVLSWYANTALSRLNNKRDGVIIIVMQRLHTDDLVGHVTERDGWTVVDIPAIATIDREYRTGELPHQVHKRLKGDVLDDRREPLYVLDEIRAEIGDYNFSAQYQQDPQPFGGNLLKRDWLRFYDPALLPPWHKFDIIVHSWDPAMVNGELNDYSVCTVWGALNGKYYLLNVVREHLDYPALRHRALQLAKADRPDLILIERAVSGIALAQDRRANVDARVMPVPPKGSKEERFAARSLLFEQGRVLFPQSASWLDTLVKELLSFPASKHDDQVDSVEMFLRATQALRNFPNGGVGSELRRRNPVRRNMRRKPSTRPEPEEERFIPTLCVGGC